MKFSQPTIGIWAADPVLFKQGEAELDLELKTQSHLLGIPITDKADLLLLKTPSGWKLSSQILNLCGILFVDYVEGKNARRQRIPGAGKQPLAKAIGIKKSQRPTVLDATAGLGGDAYLLAALGCKVWLCERNPVIATLLKDAIQRAKANHQTSQLFSNSMLFSGATLDDAQQSLDETPEVIYLDPMYPKPTKKRSANVKKEMQIMRTLLAPDIDAADWLKKARNWSKKVVVKRPTWAKPLATDVHGCVESKNHRYDIFMGTG